MDYLLVDTFEGLKIVIANKDNYYNSSYDVQMLGTVEECKKEKNRIESWNP